MSRRHPLVLGACAVAAGLGVNPARRRWRRRVNVQRRRTRRIASHVTETGSRMLPVLVTRTAGPRDIVGRRRIDHTTSSVEILHAALSAGYDVIERHWHWKLILECVGELSTSRYIRRWIPAAWENLVVSWERLMTGAAAVAALSEAAIDRRVQPVVRTGVVAKRRRHVTTVGVRSHVMSRVQRRIMRFRQRHAVYKHTRKTGDNLTAIFTSKTMSVQCRHIVRPSAWPVTFWPTYWQNGYFCPEERSRKCCVFSIRLFRVRSPDSETDGHDP